MAWTPPSMQRQNLATEISVKGRDMDSPLWVTESFSGNSPSCHSRQVVSMLSDEQSPPERLDTCDVSSPLSWHLIIVCDPWGLTSSDLHVVSGGKVFAIWSAQKGGALSDVRISALVEVIPGIHLIPSARWGDQWGPPPPAWKRVLTRTPSFLPPPHFPSPPSPHPVFFLLISPPVGLISS